MPCAHSDNHHLGFSACLSINKDVTIPLPVSRIPFILKLMGPLSASGSHNSALCSVVLLSRRVPTRLGIQQRGVPNRLAGETIQDIYCCLEGQKPVINYHLRKHFLRHQNPSKKLFLLQLFQWSILQRHRAGSNAGRAWAGGGGWLSASRAGTSWAGFTIWKTHLAASSERDFSVLFSRMLLGSVTELCWSHVDLFENYK